MRRNKDCTRQECTDVDISISRMLVELMKEEEIRNGTICYWCMMHPKSPEVVSLLRLAHRDVCVDFKLCESYHWK